MKQKAIRKGSCHSRQRHKTQHAIAWIQYIARVFAECGYDQKAGSTVNDVYLPYDSFRELYEEYENFYCRENAGKFQTKDKVTASKEVFRTAWISLKHIKLRTAKGNNILNFELVLSCHPCCFDVTTNRCV